MIQGLWLWMLRLPARGLIGLLLQWRLHWTFEGYVAFVLKAPVTSVLADFSSDCHGSVVEAPSI
jgi:hypothetical protein